MLRTAWLLPLFALAGCGPAAPARVAIRDAWARESSPGQSSAAVYATIANDGGSEARLTGAKTDVAAMAMIHSNASSAGVSRMRVNDAVAVPAHGRAELKPGGTHIMLDGLKQPLRKGSRFELRLRFADGKEQRALVQVVGAGER